MKSLFFTQISKYILFVVSTILISTGVISCAEAGSYSSSNSYSSNSSSTSSSSSSYSGNAKVSSSFTLTKGGVSTAKINKDTFKFKLLSVDVSPLAYDGAGKAVVQVTYNGVTTKQNFTISSGRMPRGVNYFDRKLVGKKYFLTLTSFNNLNSGTQVYFTLSNK
jgi:hypothetical protein